MNCRVIAVLIMVMSTALGFCDPGESGRPILRQLQHPEVAGKYIHAVCGKDGVRIWGMRNSILIEHENGDVESFSGANSPIAIEGTITDVAFANGEIWVAQTAPSQGLGLFKFDGKVWETLKFPDAPGLLNNHVTDIHIDNDDQIWFGHKFHGISRYVERVIPTFGNYKIMHLYDCNLLRVFMQETHLWIGTTNGIVRLRTELKSNYDLNVDKWVFPDFPAREAFSICDFNDDMVVAGTSRGVAFFNGHNWALRSKTDGIIALPANHLQRQNGRIWIGSPAGLQFWAADRVGQLLTEADGLPANNITALTTDENGNLLIGTEKGAAILVPAAQ
jgi:hypothetical protein